MTLKDHAKYFLHGVPFTLFFINLWTIWGWISLLVAFTRGASLYVGVVVLFLLLGGINALIAGGLDALIPLRIQKFIPRFLKRFLNWRLWFTMKRSIFRLFFQGLLLAILLLVVDFLFRTLLFDFYTGLLATVVSYIVCFYLDGRLAQGIASAFRGIED